MLSEEQKQMVEDSLWVVNAVLKKQGLQRNEDIRQDAILYMCQCVQRYVPSKNIKWTTYAYKNIELFVKRFSKKQKQKEIPKESFGEEKVISAIVTRQYNDYAISESRCSINEINTVCSDVERQIINLKVKGYTEKEIAKNLNINPTAIRVHMKHVIRKSREVFLEK